MIKKRITLSDLQRFEIHLEQTEKASATIEKYLRDLRKFYNFTGVGGRFDRQMVLAYKKYLSERYLPSSVNSMLAALNSYFAFRGLDQYKVSRLRIQKQIFCPEEKELTKSEYKRLLAAALRMNNERIALIMQTICSTGIRVSELACITVDALERGHVTVSCKNKTRMVWIPEKLRRRLKEYAKCHGIADGTVFITNQNNPVDRSNVWKEMKRLCKEADVCTKKVYPHNLRHLFARCYYEKEKDIVRLGDVLGHSSLETTRIYTISSGKEYAGKINALDLVL